jgi:DNA polymerase III alpha subunit (gram-positive type)
MPDPRVLVLDIETSPMLVYVWNLKDQYVNLNQMVEDWHIMAWSAKWLGEPASKIQYYDLRDHKRGDDLPILRPLWKLLNKADIVLTQNGKAFDAKKINARFMLHGMKPPRPYRHIDTYLISKKVADFTSHSLEYLTDKFCVKYKKLSHHNFPGLKLWVECLKGNIAAWNEMRLYNIHDVLSTEEFYQRIRAWAPESTPKPFVRQKGSMTCETCGDAGRMTRRGLAVKQKLKYQRWQCQTCGGWATGEKVK